MQQETSNFKKNFSEGLKYARLRRGVTLEELAAAVGEKSGSVIANWERGANGPHRGKLLKVADYFGVDIDPESGLWSPRTRSSVLREAPGLPDLSWMLADFDESTLVEKLVRVLRDGDVELGERIRRAETFLDELRRRVVANSSIDAIAKAALGKAVADIQNRPEGYPQRPGAASTSGKASGQEGGAGRS